MTKILTLFKLLLTLPLSFIYIFSGFVPRDRKIWIFGSYKDLFIDNSKYLYLYVNNYHKDINAIWQTQSKLTYKYLHDNGFNVVYKYSILGFYYGLRAKVSIISSKRWNVNPYVLKNNFIVNVWHGIPLKKIEYDVSRKNNEVFFKRQFHYKLLSSIWPYFKNNHDLYIASSKVHCEIIKSAFNISESQVIISGEPSYDDIFVKSIQTSDKYIAYLPTFRLNYSFNYFANDFNGEAWDEFLGKNGKKLIIKLHVNDKFDKSRFCKNNYDNIKFIDSAFDSADILSKAELLITDYSSVMFDCANRKKPVLFYAPDKEIYQKSEREFYFDYDKISGSHIFNNWNDLLDYLKKVDINNIENTDYLNNIVGCSSNSCEMLYHEIIKRI